MDNNSYIQESAVICILGRRGHGKTALLTKIGEVDYNEGKRIITNYEVSFPHIQLTFEEIVMLPEILQNATLLLDEFQVGASARTALKKANQSINKFITQLRKRNVVLYYSTQNFKFMDIDVRTQTDYILATEVYNKENNEFKVLVMDRHDVSDSPFGSIIKRFTWNASDMFERKVFNTNEIISFGKED